ncbi:hypothetical protein F5887DRAFT_126750 [Amanita rubescens]|nr:hypothetical protein F5887DRAFT_126750 [Amanita rubescens]
MHLPLRRLGLWLFLLLQFSLLAADSMHLLCKPCCDRLLKTSRRGKPGTPWYPSWLRSYAPWYPIDSDGWLVLFILLYIQ